MATVVLAAVGAAVGGSMGGTVAGLSMAAAGRLAGAVIGRVIDQRIMGGGSRTVETGRVDRFRVTSAAEGQPVAQIFGRMRVGGQVIWASQFEESTSRSGGGGKGARRPTPTVQYSYSVSLAIALCEGEIARVGRVWADGVEVSTADLNMRVYTGARDQMPDPKIEAVEGAAQAPAYRGTAYVVFEDLALDRFGNRVPQFSFEVLRPEVAEKKGSVPDVRAVALMPGTGEYALARSKVHYGGGTGESWSANENTPSGLSDFETSLESLNAELPACGSVSLVASWFGDDLRCGSCSVRPKVEQVDFDGVGMPWNVSGLSRVQAEAVARIEDRPVYGGTPTDASIIEAIQAIRESGKEVMFYPFLLMEILEGNTLPDPWSDGLGQSALPWRGRITLDRAPGMAGTTDGTNVAAGEVAIFFGSASAGDFVVGDGEVAYLGPDDWGYRRFVLHYAAICAAAGGVESFCIGSEMRSLTQVRGAANSFPAVEALRDLAREVRVILGPDTKIGYAADWSEYFGYHPQDGSGDVFFHLDPLWSDEDIDFVGIDNYMPLADWRDGGDHKDADFRDVRNLDYLKANIAGGEGFDWFYQSDDARDAQIRTPIEDGAHGEHWVYRYKDLRGWWANSHHNRIGGQRMAEPTGWVPAAKPIWFTELGCAAVEKGANQPNKFHDPKSSESGLPHYSNGQRDDAMQLAYLRAMSEFWAEGANNPVSGVYEGPMVDMARAHVWAWDARPFPAYPNRRDLWSDGENYARGHWINGRSSNVPLAEVVAAVCARSGLGDVDVSGLRGVVRGYLLAEVAEGRAALQPLMLAYGFDAVERDGVLAFRMRGDADVTLLDEGWMAVSGEAAQALEASREAEAETVGRVRLEFYESDGDFQPVAEETVLPDEATHAIAGSELSLSLTRAEGRQITERWLSEARLARDHLRFSLPPSRISLGAGDVVQHRGGAFRIDRVEQGDMQHLEAVRIEASVYDPSEFVDEPAPMPAFQPPLPVEPLFLDLPLMRGDETPHAPYLAVSGNPWPGDVALYDAVADAGYALNGVFGASATMGVTQTPLLAEPAGLLGRGAPLRVKLVSGTLASLTHEALLAGGNLAAIGDGTPGGWELFQFSDAELIAPQTYWLRHRLRGQFGTEGVMPAAWPEGSQFVLLNEAVQQIDLATNARGVSRHYRVGPARRGYDDPSYRHEQHAFDGRGLRPYAPAHLAIRSGAGGFDLSWVRRTRIDGDLWDLPEVPLGEESEAYSVRVLAAGSSLREAVVTTPTWHYAQGDYNADAAQGGLRIEVAQISARYGAGGWAGIDLD